MIGQTFGDWKVLTFSRPNITGERTMRDLWWCECSCGTKHEVDGRNLRTGRSKNCVNCGHKRTHGHSHLNSRAYTVWRNMRQRCERKTHPQYSNYGGRGISVHESWQKFENFLAYMGEPGPGQSLDRINNNGNYEPGNCRWATKKEQDYNRRVSRIFQTSTGQTFTIEDLVRMSGKGYSPIFRYIQRNGPDKAFIHYGCNS
jgi:hypothetical protein